MFRVMLLIAFALFAVSGAFAWTHGKSSANLISGASEFLKSASGDQLVSQ